MDNNAPKISVLITSYNYAKYLPEAIESVLLQTYGDYELLIVDNCSTDNTIEVVKNYMKQDSRVKLHINESNIGMYRNYNQALLLAKGEYIKFLNADDKFECTLLDKFINIFNLNQNATLVTSYRETFGSKSVVLKQPFYGLLNGRDAILKALELGNWIGEPTTVMFKRSSLNLGLFDTSLLMFADYDMWLRQLQHGDIYIIDEVLSYFREHSTQATKSLNDNLDKEVFSFLQLQEYKKYSMQINKFGYNFMNKEKDNIFFSFTKNSMKYFSYAFKNKAYSQQMKIYIKSSIIDYVLFIPKKNYYRFKKSIEKRFK